MKPPGPKGPELWRKGSYDQDLRCETVWVKGLPVEGSGKQGPVLRDRHNKQYGAA